MPTDETTISQPTVPLIELLTAKYRRALAALPDDLANGTEEEVIDLLLAREEVARALAQSAQLPSETLHTIASLDRSLKQRAISIDTLVGRNTLERWRETIQPAASAWWWQLDTSAAAQRTPHPLWGIVAAFIITISLSFSAEITKRFLGAGPDALSFFNTAAQALLTLLAGSALTHLGWKAISRRMERLGIPSAAHPLWKVGIALAVFCVVLAIRFALPSFARFYNDRGVALQEQGQISGALELYLRAVNIAPDYAQARYNLATAYEDVREYDKALGEYRRAVEADDQFYAAYNNLGRLYLVHQKQYGSALALINRMTNSTQFSNLPASVRYSLLKNRGWAYYGLQLYGLAQADLQQALALRPDGAAAHCLLAQTFEAQQESQAAQQEWELCLAYELNDFVEPEWPALARSKLSGRGEKP